MNKMLENGEITDADFVDIDGESEDISDMQRDIDSQMNNIFMEFGGDDRDTEFKIFVKRVMPGKGEFEHCFTALPSELPITDKITEHYGPGDYLIMVYRDGKIWKKRKLFIAKPLKKITPATPQNNGTDLAAVLAAMAEQNRIQMENFQRIMMMQTPHAPIATPTTPITELVTAMAGMQKLMQPAPVNNGMDQFIKGIEIAKEFGNENNGAEKGLADVLIASAREFGEPLMEMIKSMPKPALQGAQQVIPQTQPPVKKEADPMFMLKMQLKMLVSKARNEADPALYADLILDSMDETRIRAFLGEANLRAFLIDLNPEVDLYWPWFEALQREVMIGLEGGVENDTPIANENENDLTNIDTGNDTPNNSESIGNTPDAASGDSTEETPPG